MKSDLSKLSGWEFDKAIYLCRMARELNMKLDGYGELNVNNTSGNTYLWTEDYPFSLYMPINCELQKEDVWVLYFDNETGDESEERLSSFSGLEDIYEWVKELETTKD